MISETSAAFVGGCVSGAIVASGVSVIVDHMLSVADEQAAAEVSFSNASHASAPAHGAQRTNTPKHAAVAGRSNAGYGRHSAAARAVDEWEKTGEIRMQNVFASKPAHAAHKVSPEDTSVYTVAASAPKAHHVQPKTQSQSTPAEPKAPASNDYADVAVYYVEKQTLAERLNVRAKGVANVLFERLNASKMDGMPVIARGASSASATDDDWWGSSLNPSSTIRARTEAQLQAQQSQKVQETSESRWSDKQQDLWSVALSALDDRFAEQIALGPTRDEATFVDEIGDAQTIDEPEGLEPDTMFMSFKPMAGHPEVQDTTSYVDLLIDQEFAHNSSSAARKSVRGVLRNYLKVVDGGTGQLVSGAKHMAAHMAPSAPSVPAVQIAY